MSFLIFEDADAVAAADDPPLSPSYDHQFRPIAGAYPGLGLSHLHTSQGLWCPLGSHPACPGNIVSDMLPVREVAMLLTMDALTDVPDWNQKVFDDCTVKKWKQEALNASNEALFREIVADKDLIDVKQPRDLLSARSFDFCIKELRGKARHFDKTGIVPTLDACSAVAKADTLVPNLLRNRLILGLTSLRDDQMGMIEHSPGDPRVLDLLHPATYPLVYGRSRVFREECVGVQDAVRSWAGKGQIIESPKEKDGHVLGGVTSQLWSSNYQLLPSNVNFDRDGKPRITSYVNNLHPTKYPELYEAIEDLIDAVIPMWDQCLKVTLDPEWELLGAGRQRSRFFAPSYIGNDNLAIWDPPLPIHEIAKQVDDYERAHPGLLALEEDLEVYKHWLRSRRAVHPEPETFFPTDYAVKSSLRESCRESGFQVFVKISSVELTPESPEFPAGNWHIEGQMNEHIAASALYYLDVDNVTPGKLYFRQSTASDTDLDNSHEEYSYLENIYGTNLRNGGFVQNLGRVATPQGRLLAFPNVLQHRTSPFHLIDPSRPGRRTYIALWLVDPGTRIISTANVPPQQQEWWLAEALNDDWDQLGKLSPEILSVLAEYNARHMRTSCSSDDSETTLVNGDGGDESNEGISCSSPLTQRIQREALGGGDGPYNRPLRLPNELVDMVVRAVGHGALPMSQEEARMHRLRLMRERSSFLRDGKAACKGNSDAGYCED